MTKPAPITATFERMLAYDRWANGEALASLEALADPPVKARELIAHLVGAEICWLDRMTTGRESPDWEKWDHMDVATVRQVWSAELPSRWEAFLADPVMSDQRRAFTFVDFLGNTGTSCVEDVLLMLMFHAAHHRGQVASLVRAAGGTPAVTDFRAGVRRGGIPAASRG